MVTEQVIEHVRDPFLASTEVHRLLKPGGIYLFSSCAHQEVHGAPFAFFRYQPGGIKMMAAAFSGGLQTCGHWGNPELIKALVDQGAEVTVNLIIKRNYSTATAEVKAEIERTYMNYLRTNDPVHPFTIWAAAEK